MGKESVYIDIPIMSMDGLQMTYHRIKFNKYAHRGAKPEAKGRDRSRLPKIRANKGRW